MTTGLFVCESCNCVDHIELAYTVQERQYDHPQWLCTECQGKPWHNQFPKLPFDETEDNVVNYPSGIGLG